MILMTSKTKKTILSIDDDESISHTIKILLEANGYTVIASTDPREGLDIAKNEEIDLLLLDIELPGIKGTEILRITKNLAYLKKPFPIIYLSGNPKSTVNLEGSDGFIQKPFDNKVLLKAVEQYLKKGKKKSN